MSRRERQPDIQRGDCDFCGRVGPLVLVCEGEMAMCIDGCPHRCDRCDGSGVLPQFSHVDGGRCYRCNGAGTVKIGRGRIIIGRVAVVKGKGF